MLKENQKVKVRWNSFTKKYEELSEKINILLTTDSLIEKIIMV